jgi:hypothetical protein
MAGDIFGNLGGLGNLFSGIAKSVVPKDTPEGKLFAAQAELSDLQKQETEILLEIGRQVYEQNPSVWPQDAKIQLIRRNIVVAQATLDAAKQAQEQAEAAKIAEDAKGRCPNCEYKNLDGVKFCQECGKPRVFAEPKRCISCDAALVLGIRFCGECGARQE